MKSQHPYQLRFAWTAWPQKGNAFPANLPDDISLLLKAWEPDGLRPLEWNWTQQKIQCLFSCQPHCSPTRIANRAKGRLQHLLRTRGIPVSFQRNFQLTTVGSPDSRSVDRYLEHQLDHGDFADPRYRNALAYLSFTDVNVKPTESVMTKSGRYLLAYHFVFVTADRWRMPSETAEMIQNAFRKASADSHWKIGKLAMMPDHVHVAVKGVPETSPEDIGQAIQEACSRAVGTHGFWMPNWYMGTYGEYGMAGIRAEQKKRRSRSPAGQAGGGL